MIGYVLMYKGKYIGVYKTYAKALFKAMQLCKKDEFLMFRYENLKYQERLLKRDKAIKPNECLTLIKFMFLMDIYEIEAVEVE